MHNGCVDLPDIESNTELLFVSCSCAMAGNSTVLSRNKMDKAIIGKYAFTCGKFKRENGKSYRYHEACRMHVYAIENGKFKQLDGVYVVLSSLPSAERSTVHLTDFTANYWYRRTLVKDCNAIEAALLHAIKRLYKPHVRVVTHPSWFDIRGGVRIGLSANRWFAARFDLERSMATNCVIVQRGAAGM